eukprot:TRINITY_DN74431_c0_g1_i1.p1 TRINITY_DN74431_c0_g1~~TRINITY_DN74431_c0_g1_i1.p1  ORF type:complete len:425 (-),score=51.96 TRINITY_DN74431_c0_g1_i1:412-1608(-)
MSEGAVLSSVEANAFVLSSARGCMLGLMVGDALGAAVEGWPQPEIRALAQKTFGSNLIEDYISAVPMGTYVSAGEPGRYREATEVRDCNYVPTGPPSNSAVAEQCARKGMYTDDTNSCLAIGMSLVQQKRADAAHAARSCAELFRDNEAYRGCPPTAKQVLANTLAGMSPAVTGLPPHFPFDGGSFANGGAMRISPVGIAYRNADKAGLRQAVCSCLLASHRHPEAIDFAVIQAAAVQYALHKRPEEFDGLDFLQCLADVCETAAMKEVVQAVSDALTQFTLGEDEHSVVAKIVEGCRRPGSGMGFQIASIHMAPCVLWCASLHHKSPQKAIQAAIDLGGDTDTTASMVGAIVGALHGEEWCKDWAAGLENGKHGRDFALGLAEELAGLDVSKTAITL